MRVAVELRPDLVGAHRQVTAEAHRADLALTVLVRGRLLRLRVLSAAIIPGRRRRQLAAATLDPRNILFRQMKRQLPALA